MHNTVWKVSKRGLEKTPFFDTFHTAQYTNREPNITFLESLDFFIVMYREKFLEKNMLKLKKC